VSPNTFFAVVAHGTDPFLQMLIAVFDPYHIVSSKILRDSMGNSRGVGFARCAPFPSPFLGRPIS